tara:strand:- start:62 stop:352 length:291 start_codon:yes stop_codon:yes gene_type:complete
MTKIKKTKKTEKTQTEKKKLEEGKKAIEDAIHQSRKPRFGERIAKLFYGSIYCSSVAFFSVLFSLIAVVVLPILLPLSYLISAFKGKGIKLDGISR